MKKNKNILLGIVIFIALLLLADAVYTVDETQQCIITQFGEPVGDPVTEAGLHIKLPIIQKVTFFEKRIMEWDGDRNEIPTKDNKYILVDTFARWRIADPLKFFQSVNNVRAALGRLDDIIDGVTRDYISENMLIEIVRNSNRTMTIAAEEENAFVEQVDSLYIEQGRLKITAQILEKVQQTVPQYGIEVLDIRIKQVNYNNEVRKKVFDRMISERKRIAQLYRSEGMGRKAQIEGEMKKSCNASTRKPINRRRRSRARPTPRRRKFTPTPIPEIRSSIPCCKHWTAIAQQSTRRAC